MRHFRLSRSELAAALLFGLTLAVEVPVMLVRYLLAALVAVLVLLITGHDTGSATTIAYVGLAPTAWAVLALIAPLGSGWWWRHRVGGREPAQSERLAYADAIAELQGHAERPLPLPRHWFVIDRPGYEAAVCGNTLMLGRDLLESPGLPCVIAHELGHLATFDATVAVALNRLVIDPPLRAGQGPSTRVTMFGTDISDPWTYGPLILGAVVRLFARLVAFARGGFSLRVLRPLWGQYWRRCEYAADDYAASLGQADELADFMEAHDLIYDQPVPFVWLTEHTHPPTALRIDRLRAYAHAAA